MALKDTLLWVRPGEKVCWMQTVIVTIQEGDGGAGGR